MPYYLREKDCLARPELALNLCGSEKSEETLSGLPLLPDRLYLGAEFCELLLPEPKTFVRDLGAAEQRNIPVSLLTPPVSDKGLGKVELLLDTLPAGSEVIANDWGTLRLIAREASHVQPIAGRLLCRSLKDPRLPKAEWRALSPEGFSGNHFLDVLGKFGVRRLELDVPPFVTLKDFTSPNLLASDFSLSAHSPSGYTVTGRICQIGSLGQEDKNKFRAGGKCQRECRRFESAMTRPKGVMDLKTWQKGNTIFYRHSPEMTHVLEKAVAVRAVDRLVLSEVGALAEWGGV